MDIRADGGGSGAESCFHTDVLEVLTTTRSVRLRLRFDEQVSREEIHECLRIAAQAPTGAGALKAQWLVVRDREMMDALGAIYRSLWHGKYGSKIAGIDSNELPADVRSAKHLADNFGRLPAVVLGFVENGGQGSGENQASLWSSLLPAAWSYSLAARARGLATAWTTTLNGAEDEVARLFGVPPGLALGVALPTAYPEGQSFKPAARRGWRERIHDEGW